MHIRVDVVRFPVTKDTDKIEIFFRSVIALMNFLSSNYLSEYIFERLEAAVSRQTLKQFSCYINFLNPL